MSGQIGSIGGIDPRTVARSQWLAKLGSARPRISVLSGSHLQNPATANRVCAAATGHLLVLSTVALDPDDASQIDQQFRADARLGAVALGAEHGSLAGLATPELLWSALGGFDTRYADLAWAIRDYCLRARGIGYRTRESQRSVVTPAREGSVACTGQSDDAKLFVERVAVTPDRAAAAGESAIPPATRFCVYTGITDAYDGLKPQPPQALSGCRQVAFLDERSQQAHGGRHRGWEVRRLERLDRDPHRDARFAKINAHLALPDADFSLWIDASIGIVCPFPLPRLAELFLRDADLCVFRHHARRSIYEEAAACRAAGLDQTSTIDAQVVRYREEGLPENSGLIEAPILLRRHTPDMQALDEAWWSEVVRGSRRDQLSFNYVAWKLGFPYAQFPLTLASCNGLFVKFRRSESSAAQSSVPPRTPRYSV
jgi:hypothetical protein